MRFLLLFFFTFTFLNAVATSKTEQLEKVSLQLHWKYQFEFAGFIAAKEKGFYEEVGLDVELKEYEYGIDIESDVINGKSQYGIYNSQSLVDYLKGKPLKLVASFFKRAALVLVTTPDIQSPKDLVGKTIMATTKEDFILNYKPYFDMYGVNIDDLILVPHTYTIDKFVEGKVSAMTAFVSNEVNKLTEKGISYNILDPSDDNLFVLQLELFTSTKEANNHPDRVQAFKKASIKGWEYALKNQEEIAKIIYDKYTKIVPLKGIIAEAKGVEKLILPYSYDIGSIDKNFLHKQINLFKQYYNIGHAKKLDNYIFQEQKNKHRVLLSDEEKKYIMDNSFVDVCQHPNLFPIDAYVDGKHTGIIGDIYTLISEKTGLNFNIIPVKDYKELNSKVTKNVCKMISILPTDNHRYINMRMSKPIFKTYFTLISGVDKSFVVHSDELRDKKLIVRFQAHKNKILQYYPYLNIETEENMHAMMQKVLKGKVYAAVVANEAADYLIDKYGYGKLKINGFLVKENMIEGSVAVNTNSPILLSIIEKTLDDIDSQRISEIIKSWRITRYHEKSNYTLAFIILSIAFLVLGLLIYYQRKLQASNIELASTITELNQKDKLLTHQSKQAVMGEMISMIAHQWRQPLSTITLQISNLQLDKMLKKDVTPQRIDSTLSEVSDSIMYLSQTVDDFQTYFAPNKEKTEISIVELLQRVITLDIGRVKASQVQINVNVVEGIRVNIYTNELIQVLLNILNNALDAFETIDEESKYINITARLDKEYLYLLVEDNAGGVKEEYLGKLFEPYFSTKGKNGTGLGLYMSQMIIQKQFQGDIDVESSQNRTTFSIKILRD